MSIWLAIETATDVGSVALGSNGTVMAQRSFSDRRHAAALTPSIHELFNLAGKQLDDLEGLVIADGPGSFTGLRIGLATAMGIVHALPHVKIRTSPSMLVAAWGARGHQRVAVWYDALRGEVFSAVFEISTGQVLTLEAPTRATPESIIERIPAPGVVVGAGAVMYETEARQWSGNAPLGPPEGGPRAGGLIELLSVSGATSAIVDLATFEPNYGRHAEAQVRWEAEHGRPLPDS